MSFLTTLTMSCLCYLCLFAHSGVKHVFAHAQHDGCLVKGRNCLPFGSTWLHYRFLMGPVFLIFLAFRVVVFCFVCLRHVSCVPNIVNFSGLSFFDCPFDFLYRFIISSIYHFGIVKLFLKIPDELSSAVMDELWVIIFEKI